MRELLVPCRPNPEFKKTIEYAFALHVYLALVPHRSTLNPDSVYTLALPTQEVRVRALPGEPTDSIIRFFSRPPEKPQPGVKETSDLHDLFGEAYGLWGPETKTRDLDPDERILRGTQKDSYGFRFEAGPACAVPDGIECIFYEMLWSAMGEGETLTLQELNDHESRLRTKREQAINEDIRATAALVKKLPYYLRSGKLGKR